MADVSASIKRRGLEKRSSKAGKTAIFFGTYQAVPSSIPLDFLSEWFESQKLRIADFASPIRGLAERSIPCRKWPGWQLSLSTAPVAP
jgi:hypothetical protein